MLYLLLLISVSIDTLKNIYSNHFGKNIINSMEDAVLFNAVSGVGAVIYFVIYGFSPVISQYSLVMAILYAVATAGAQYCSLLAMNKGPMSLSILFTYLGMVIPTLFGIIYYEQTISVIQIIGFVLALLTIILSIDFRNHSGMNIRWFIIAMLSFIMWGIVMILQLLHQNSQYADELIGFLAYAFIFMTIIFLVIYALFGKTESKGYHIKSKSTIYVLGCGIFIGIINQINLYLSGKLPVIVFFPVVNCGVIILSGIAAIAVFKEKITKQNIAAIVVGMVSVCMLGM